MPDHYHEAVRVQSEDLLTDLLELDVEGELADRQERIQGQIEEVRQELERRENIHEENERDLRTQIDYQEELIGKIGADIEPDGEMRDRIQGLHENLRCERRDAFEDVQELRNELRELRKQRSKIEDGLSSDSDAA